MTCLDLNERDRIFVEHHGAAGAWARPWGSRAEELIEARGYQRRQDLQRKLADLLATLAQP
jgi:hypothetical protein